MTNRRQYLKRLVIARYGDQDGLCYYCLRLCWIRGLHRRSLAIKRLGIPENLLNELIATAEHLKRRDDGGIDHPRNIVMACAKCNNERGFRAVLDHVKACRQLYQRWNQRMPVAA